jgi:hypothetical protein
MPPVTQNHEGNNSKTAGGVSGTGDIIPAVDNRNHAQSSEIGDTRGNGGILPTHIEGKQADAQAENDGLPSSGEPNSIYRLGHSDTFACHNCKQKGDKWFMQKHLCTGANDKLSL